MLGQTAWIEEYAETAGEVFRFSSAFPWLEKVLFFPKPFRPLDLGKRETSQDSVVRKKVKKIKWYDQTWLEKYLAGNVEEFRVVPEKYEELIQNECLTNFLDSKEKIGIYSRENQQRVAVPRGSGADATPFYTDRLHFRQDVECGLFCLATFGQDQALWEKRISVAFRLLETEGFGTDRSTGNGAFKLSEDELKLNLPDRANVRYWYSLGWYAPENREELLAATNPDAWYELLERGGFVTTPPHLTLRRKTIYGFRPGSVFSGNMAPKGRLHDVRPVIATELNHPIYRCGKPIFLPVV
jgi:CRISPR type III-A-associated RAMP protein Csm4